MPQSINKLKRAKMEKNDEYYTPEEYVARICTAFRHHLKGKKVYANCDMSSSAFVRYIEHHTDELEIASFDYSYISYDDPENLKKLDACDIVITNPPFSIYKTYLETLYKHGKDFVLVAPLTILGSTYFYKYFQNGKIFPTNITCSTYTTPGGGKATVNTQVITTFDDMDLYVSHPPNYVQNDIMAKVNVKYDNYDARECPRIEYLSLCDHNEIIGVPITFLKNDHRDEWEIIDLIKDAKVNGKRVFGRYFIKKRNLKEK